MTTELIFNQLKKPIFGAYISFYHYCYSFLNPNFVLYTSCLRSIEFEGKSLRVWGLWGGNPWVNEQSLLALEFNHKFYDIIIMWLNFLYNKFI